MGICQWHGLAGFTSKPGAVRWLALCWRASLQVEFEGVGKGFLKLGGVDG